MGGCGTQPRGPGETEISLKVEYVPKATVSELRQYIMDLEEGVAVRFDDVEARLGRIESDLAIIKEHLVTKIRQSENKPNGSFE